MVQMPSDEMLRDAATEDVSLLVAGSALGWVSFISTLPSTISSLLSLLFF
jgi:hypothetical protein